jgi:sugar phosphate isomerase/epimerase
VKLAISNIAWPLDQDRAVAELLARHGVGAIEVAPTKIWRQPLEASRQVLAEYRGFWNQRGIEIVAAQSLLFGRPELMLFDDARTRAQTLAYLRQMVQLCAQLGCQSLVFGSPKNRRIGSQPPAAAWPIAVDFFRSLGETATAEGTCLVLEANPPSYGADFIVRAKEAVELVRAVDRPGFGLHLDSACMAMVDDPIAEVLADAAALLKHFHVSQRELAPVGDGTFDHRPFAQALRDHKYTGWISIEMRESAPFSVENLAAALEYTRAVFG